MPDGALLMVYNVRRVTRTPKTAFPDTASRPSRATIMGRPGTWSIATSWSSIPGTKPKKGDVWWSAATQGTSSILLPDGSILTAFGSGYRVDPSPAPGADTYFPRDIGLIRWKP